MDVENMPGPMMFFHLSKTNKKHDELLKLIKESEIINKLGEYGINISINTEIPNDSMFKVEFYNNGTFIKLYSEGEIKDIIDDALSMMGKNSMMGGKRTGSVIYYMHKYKKYKKKYQNLLNKK